MYEKVIVSTVMYESDLWGMKVTERQNLNVFEIKCLRSMAGVSRLDKVKNEVVRVRTGVRNNLAARMDMNVLKWFGHVERMENNYLLKRVMNANTIQNRNKETPESVPNVMVRKVKEALKVMKRGKVAGEDGLKIDFIMVKLA
ncbi:uncharacterized protein [Palaemon carinicauda]|uniref:uncharacterized protein n=1 Tax=Palaemon carinicauda TaxID=392227 RepID=UPI0035B686E9